MHIYPIPLEPQEIHSLWMQAASEEPISTFILTEAGNLGFGTGRGEIRSSKLFSFTCQCKTTPLRRLVHDRLLDRVPINISASNVVADINPHVKTAPSANNMNEVYNIEQLNLQFEWYPCAGWKSSFLQLSSAHHRSLETTCPINSEKDFTWQNEFTNIYHNLTGTCSDSLNDHTWVK